jgi:hypothetical protein
VKPSCCGEISREKRKEKREEKNHSKPRLPAATTKSLRFQLSGARHKRKAKNHFDLLED